MKAERTGASRRVTAWIRPVSPMPPRVAQKQVGELDPRAAHHVAAGEHHLELVDEGPEGADAVVVLAVDVGGDAAAEGAVPGPGGDRREPAAREGEAITSSRVTPAWALRAPLAASKSSR